MVDRALAGGSAQFGQPGDKAKQDPSPHISGASAHPNDVVVGGDDRATLRPEDNGAQQALFRDIDTVLARLENGIATENAAMDALLSRLARKAA